MSVSLVVLTECAVDTLNTTLVTYTDMRPNISHLLSISQCEEAFVYIFIAEVYGTRAEYNAIITQPE